MTTRWIVAAAAAVGVGVLAVPMLLGNDPPAYLDNDAPELVASHEPACKAERKANLDFALKDMNGASVKVEDFRGKAILLNYWATWCGPCKVEIPIFNELYAQGSQIVLSSDRPPEAMGRLSERMRDRFAWGLTVELQGPDPATRITLLRRLAVENGIPVPDLEVLQQIAGAAPGNLRRLEGALTRVTAFASMLGEVPSVDLVRKALGSDAEPIDATPVRAPAAERLARKRVVVLGEPALGDEPEARLHDPPGNRRLPGPPEPVGDHVVDHQPGRPPPVALALEARVVGVVGRHQERGLAGEPLDRPRDPPRPRARHRGEGGDEPPH